jgi:cytochrome b6-f complex iron-sulfur subunit
MFAISSGTAIGIGIAVVVVLAALVLLVTARRSDVRGAGALSRETRQRDVGTAAKDSAAREVEASARGTTLVKAPEVEAAPWVPPDPEQIGVSRRHVLNLASITLMTASLGAFGREISVATRCHSQFPINPQSAIRNRSHPHNPSIPAATNHVPNARYGP